MFSWQMPLSIAKRHAVEYIALTVHHKIPPETDVYSEINDRRCVEHNFKRSVKYIFFPLSHKLKEKGH